MKRVLFAFITLLLFVGSAAAGGIKVGKALRKTANVVSMPVRKPAASMKALTIGTVNGFLASIESVGVVVQTVGLGVEKVGVLVYDIGKAISGNPPAPAPSPAPVPTP